MDKSDKKEKPEVPKTTSNFIDSFTAIFAGVLGKDVLAGKRKLVTAEDVGKSIRTIITNSENRKKHYYNDKNNLK